MFDEKILRSIQILSIQAAEDPGVDDYYERICRWYSREFSTPLMAVRLELDPLHVLRTFYDDHFLSLKDGDENKNREYEKQKFMILFPGEYEKSTKKEDDWIKKLESEVSEDQGKLKKEQKKISKKVNKALDKAAKKVAESIVTSVFDAQKELNLPDDLKIPDSGSFGE